MYVRKEGVILEPSKHSFERTAVLNPACIKVGNSVHMYYRAVARKNYSTIGYCRLDGPLDVAERMDRPLIKPQYSYEKYGTEDPRVVKIGRKYYMTYVSFNGNANIAYATSNNLRRWKKHGVIGPQMSFDEVEEILHKFYFLNNKYFFFMSYKGKYPESIHLWDKDAVLFPKKIRGKFVMLHRIYPDIQIASFKNFKELNRKYWREYLDTLPEHILLKHAYPHEKRNIGGGCPPIETKKGWLIIYHAVREYKRGHIKGKVYTAAAALLDRKNPKKVIGHLKKPLFVPSRRWERCGIVNNVVFPTGAALFGDKLYIYYGAADKRIGAASVDINDLLHELKKS